MFGIRNIWRLAALVSLCAIVAPVTAAQTQAFAPATIQVSPLTVEVKPGLNYATFNIRTNTPSRVLISFGTDRANMVSKPDSSLRTSRSVRITPLPQATQYFYSVTATDRNGKSAGHEVVP